MYNRWEWEQQRRNPLFSHKSTVKTERITPHFYPSFALLRATLSLASARRIPKPPPPPHGFRCRRSRPVKIQASLGNEPPVIPNLPTTLLSTPATSSRGRLCLSRLFLRADGDTQPSFLAFGLHRCRLFATRLVRDLDQHTHPTTSMAQHNRLIERPKRTAPQGCLHRL